MREIGMKRKSRTYHKNEDSDEQERENTSDDGMDEVPLTGRRSRGASESHKKKRKQKSRAAESEDGSSVSSKWDEEVKEQPNKRKKGRTSAGSKPKGTEKGRKSWLEDKDEEQSGDEKQAKKDSDKNASFSSENNDENAENQEKDADVEQGEESDDDDAPIQKKKQAKKSKGSKSEENEGDEEYEVEKILGEKYMKGARYLLIRWKGYGSDSDTWEPESTLNCPELIKKFEATAAENGSSKSKKKQNGASEAEKKSKKAGNKGVSPKKAKGDEQADWSESEQFEVQRILEVHHKANGKREFLVSWKGYPSASDTWEPEEHLECPDLIKKFMNKVKKAKQYDQKELRINRTLTERFTLSTNDSGRRLSRRLGTKQRIQYTDAE